MSVKVDMDPSQYQQSPDQPVASAPMPTGMQVLQRRYADSPYTAQQAWIGTPSQTIVPPNNIGWAVVTIFMFWPLAFAAFSNSFDVLPKWSNGDYLGAFYASKRVQNMGLLSMVLGTAFWGLVALTAPVIAYFVVFVTAAMHANVL